MEERLNRQEWEVRPVDFEVAKRLVRDYHYARGGSNTRCFVHGLFRVGEIWDENCKGVAWWIPPTRDAAVATYPERPEGVLSLSRLVIVPGVPKNACSFLLSRSVKLIPVKDWPCLVTYADEWKGHTGAIYKASNWQYVGLTKPQEIFVLNGVMKSRKAGNLTRSRTLMLAIGCQSMGKHARHKYILIRDNKTVDNKSNQ